MGRKARRAAGMRGAGAETGRTSCSGDRGRIALAPRARAEEVPSRGEAIPRVYVTGLTLLLHRTANFRDLAQVFHDVAHVCDLARAGKPRRARYIYGCEAAADRARLGRDLEPDRAGRLLRDQGHAIE